MPFLSKIRQEISEHLFPHPEGKHRAKLVHHDALTYYILFLSAAFLFVRFVGFRFPGVLGFASDIKKEDIIALTNSERQRAGLNLLSENAVLEEAARRKAEDMFRDNYWAHIAPDGTEPWLFFSEAGYQYLYAGENLARDFNHSTSVVRAWMDSPTHRENILNSRYREIGVAVVNGTLGGFETTLVVQLFGTPSYVAAAAPRVGGEKTSNAASFVGEAPSEAPAETPAPSETISAPTPSSAPAPFFDLLVLGRTIALFIGGFILLIFAIDGFVAWRKSILRLSGHTLAHLGILIFALVSLLFVSSGVVL